MDPTKTKTLEEVLAGISIEDAESGYDYVGRSDTVTLNLGNYSNTVIGGGYSYPNIISAPNGPYTITSGAGTGSLNPWATTTTLKGAQLELEGPDADVIIDGKSLTKTIEAIEQRLNILNVNTELEAEWSELRALGDQYRELEQHIKEKQATWDKLKAMPPPAID